MLIKTLCIFLIMIQFDVWGQQDSSWNVMVLNKEKKPIIKDNMAEFSQTGFYLFRNCFYDLQFIDKSRKTLRLIDIKPDTLIFIGVSNKKTPSLAQTSKDTVRLNYRTIDKLLLVKDWGSEASKKIHCNKYYFIFHKSHLENKYDSKYAYVFSGSDIKSEIVPRLSSYGITYHFEYGGKLYYHSGISVKVPTYSDEQKMNALQGVMSILDLMVNNRLNINIQKTSRQ